MKTSIIYFFLFLSMYTFGQEKFVPHDFIPKNIPSYKPAYNKTFPKWAKLLYEENINFHELQKEYKKWKTHSSNEFKAIERYFKIWSRHISPYVLEDGSIRIPNQANTESLNQIDSSSSNQWKFVGPKETFYLNETGGEIATASCPWQVNVYAFDVSKSNDSILYCGTETGFLNKSIDHGNSWQLMAKDYSFGAGITAIAIDPQNSNIVYVAAASQIHKTINGGHTWNILLPTDGLFYSDKIIIDENNSDKLISAGSSGIYYSDDGGINWTNSLQQQTYDIHFNTNNSDIVYAISSSYEDFKILTSNNGGMSFTNDSSFPSNIEDDSGALMAVSADEPESIFVLLLSSNDTPLLYKKNNSNNWELVVEGQSEAFPLENWQGFYDLVFEVSPDDADIIFAGTSSLFKSTDGGTNFSITGGYGGNFPIHPDVQCMVLLDNDRAWLATDGGITYSSDNFTNTNQAISKNKNLVGSDMWGFDQGWNEDIIVGGRYHNGNTAIADFYQPKALRMGGAESPTGWVLKGKSRHVTFDDLGLGWILPTSAESSPVGRFPFNMYPNMDEYGGRRGNMLFHPNYYEVIYLGEGDGFWKSDNMGVSFELLNDFGERIRYIQISYSQPNVIYADIVNLGLFKSEDGGYNWEAKPTLTNGIYGASSWKGKLHFDISPTDPNTIYACLQNGIWSSDLGKIFKSTDGGDSWTDWTGSLNPYTKNIVVQPDNEGNDILYLFSTNTNGNDANCYIRKNEDSDWSIYGQGFPVGTDPNYALPFYRDSKLRLAGTSGVWEIPLYQEDFKVQIQPWVNSPVVECFTDTIQLEDHSMINHENCNWNWEIEPTPTYIENENKRNPKVVLGAVGSYNITLNITKNNITYSKTIDDMIIAKECPSLDNCNNPTIVPTNNWTLKYVNSEEVNYPGLAEMAFDGNHETIWHTQWSIDSDQYPHQIEIDMSENFKVYEFTYQTRQDNENGRIKDFELYFSNNLNDFGTADTIGQFTNTSAPQTLVFSNPKVGRYMKLVALTEVNGNPWASAAEFMVKGCFNTSEIKTKNFESLKAYPIPTRDNLRVSLPFIGSYNYSIYTIDGKELQKSKTKMSNDYLDIDLSSYENGIYIIEVNSNNGNRYLIKSIKK